MTSLVAEQKKELRKRIKTLKDLISLEEKKKRSESIWEQMEQNPVFKKAKTIMLYWSMPDEVYTHDFIEKWHTQKQIILPSVCGDELKLKVFDGREEMLEGECFCILEPTKDFQESENSIHLIIVPGIAFDKQNNRMGRGKAFYDKLLSTTSCYKMGVCFNFQLVDHVPTNAFDVPMDLIISEKPNFKIR